VTVRGFKLRSHHLGINQLRLAIRLGRVGKMSTSESRDVKWHIWQITQRTSTVECLDVFMVSLASKRQRNLDERRRMVPCGPGENFAVAFYAMQLSGTISPLLILTAAYIVQVHLRNMKFCIDCKNPR